jgi:glycosyltransferase involved in cell wall biosynthesis
MLFPYWIPVFNKLAEKEFDVLVLVGVQNEPNRQYTTENYSDYSFKTVFFKNTIIDLRNFKIKTEFFHIPYGLHAELKKYNPDIIISFELGLRTVVAKIYAFLLHKPLIYWLCVSDHSERKNSILREFWRKLLLFGSKTVITNMHAAKRYLVNSLKVNPVKIFFTPYAVDVNKNLKIKEQFKESAQFKKQLKLKKIVLLYVGQIIERKGIHQLFSALRTVDIDIKERLSVLIIGGKLSAECKTRDLHVVNIDFVQPDFLYRYYSIADVFILPTLEDEWGIVLNEAASFGLPLIASKFAGATEELVEDNKNGIIVDPYVHDNIKNALETICNFSDQDRRNMGQYSIKKVNEYGIDYTLSNMIQALNNSDN